MDGVICAGVRVCADVRVCVCVYVYVHIHMCVYVCVCVVSREGGNLLGFCRIWTHDYKVPNLRIIGLQINNTNQENMNLVLGVLYQLHSFE